MRNSQTSDNPKIPVIIESALAILEERGDHGLTMRQVAARAGMSLSNLQYYFKNKNELLKGMADFYLDKCVTAWETQLAASEAVSVRQRISEFMAFGLGEAGSLSEFYRIFRELWAISTRNEEINAYVNAYYRNSTNIFSEAFSPLTTHPETIPLIVSLLLPYFEGYSITASALPLDKEQLAQMLTDIVMSILEREGSLNDCKTP